MNEAAARTIEQDEEGGATTTPPPSPTSLRQALGIAGSVVGLIVALTGCACGPLLALMTFLAGEGPPTGPDIQQPLTLTVLGVGLGLILATAGWAAWKGTLPRPFHPRRTWPLWLTLALLLLGGILASTSSLLVDYLLPLVNTITMLLLPILILLTVGRVMSDSGGTWRDVSGGLLGGLSLGVGLSMLVEMSVVVLLVVAALALGLIPGGINGLESLLERLQDPNFFFDPQFVDTALSPLVIATVLAFVAGVTPLVEEIAKTLGVGVAGLWLRPRPARAFLLGVASGAGFALAENLLNSALVSSLWGPGALSRLAATLMHCATGGLMGWGWGQLWANRRPWRLALAFAGAITLHGVWNGLAMGVAFSGLYVSAHSENILGVAAAGMGTLAMVAALVLLALMSLGGLLWAGRALGRGTVDQR